jgi:AraC-like DNA-binding protein
VGAPAEGRACGWLLVFPRTPLLVADRGAKAVVADSSAVRFLNRFQEYRCEKLLDVEGRCDWFSFDQASVAAAIRSFDPAVDERQEAPFALPSARADPTLYMAQRRLLTYAASGQADPLQVEEAMQALLAKAVASAYASRPATRESSTTQRIQLEIVAQVERLLAARFREHLTLSDIAALAGCSPFHLARIFRVHTGTSLHARRLQLRLCAALDAIGDDDRDLTNVALDLGFASHSHLTDSFRRAFGIAPNDLRRAGPGSRRVRRTSTILEARS